MLDRFRADPDQACVCEPIFEDDRLILDATDCPGGGRLAQAPACRRAAIEALADRDANTITTHSQGCTRAYEDDSAALLVATGRFVEQAEFHDPELTMRAAADPLAAAREAAGRAGPVSDAVAESGLGLLAERASSYDDALRPFVGPTIARSRVSRRPLPGSSLDGEHELDTGATVRLYSHPDAELRTYHLEPVEARLDPDALESLAAAYGMIAEGKIDGGRRAPRKALQRVVRSDGSPATHNHPVTTLAGILRKHTRGLGVLDDFFSDSGVSDVYATSPVGANRLRVVIDGEPMRTNVKLTDEGAAALASQFRRRSGRPFSRANPTLDATTSPTTNDRQIRIAGVTDPVSDGPGFAFRAHDTHPWTLPALVANETLPADAAALLSVAVERNAASLVAGTRGAGKTTMLGALLWELAAATRTVVIEDTPELPINALQRHGRDVQGLRTTTGDDADVSPTEALRTALRLGEGALVLGEVRGEEARVLYEAMRVGAGGSAVLGTIHGDGAAAVRERVVSDLDVPESSFAATDALVTLAPIETKNGRSRRVTHVEEVRQAEDGAHFTSLFELDGDSLQSTGDIERGNSVLVETLIRPGESYADVRETLAKRATFLETLADRAVVDPKAVIEAHARRRNESSQWTAQRC